MGNSRIRWLVVVHAVLAAAPLLTIGLTPDLIMLPLEWTLGSFPLGSLMTLSIWVGLGRARLLSRVTIGLAAIFYLTIFPTIVDTTRLSAHISIPEWIMMYLNMVGELAIMFVLLGGTFLLMGLRFEIVRPTPGAGTAREERFQFSMLQVMIVMSAVAIVLSLLRLTRVATGHESSKWESVTIYSFLFVTFFVNTACAVFATLGFGKVRRNIALVLAVAFLLGVAASIAMRTEGVNWWLFGGSILIVVVPTVIVLVSLMVVRSCGYRLVRRTREVAVVED